MLYYLGKEGNAFKKEECKEYKTDRKSTRLNSSH